MPNFTPISNLTNSFTGGWTVNESTSSGLTTPAIEFPSSTYHSMRNFAITGTLELTGLTGLLGLPPGLGFTTTIDFGLTLDQKRDMKLIPDYRPRSKRKIK